ncbi:MAG: sensor domain-containing protein, partial [Acidimicrobiales bacterium]|nr:sensor domain-containing protein [Acidimicrobiales bacterium]
MSAPLAAPPGPDGTATGAQRAGAAGPPEPTLPAVLLRAPIAAQTWRDYVYLAVAAPLSAAALVTLVVATWFGLLLALTIVGIPLLSLIVLGAREYGALPRFLARRLLGEAVDAPRRRQPRAPGFLPWLRASLGDIDGWRAIAYVVVSFPVTVLGTWAVATALAMAGVLASYPVWWKVFHPTHTDADGVVHPSGIQLGEFYIDTWPRALGTAAVGVAALFVIPWLARLVTTADRLLVRGLLGPTKIATRLDDLEVTRAHAVDDSAATLRRIERDLHDGTQARLVALAMHLDLAKEKLAGERGGDDEVARARELLERAHRNATDAIVELREVTRSIHPPALDRGLDEALATLAARSG